jgi:hypothetical protein
MADAMDLIEQLRRMVGAKFAAFTYRSRETNELARYVLILGANLTTLYEKDRETLTALLPTLDGLKADAATALLASIDESLAKGLGHNAAYTHGPEQGDTYETILPGLKIHKTDGTLHVTGLLHRKTVLEEGVHKVVKSKPLTLAKREIERELRRSKIRQFRLPNLLTAKLNGETLELAV